MDEFSFNGKPQATVTACADACGSPLNDSINRPLADFDHALNRGNLRADIFRTDADFAAFERILHEGLQIYHVELYNYQLKSNHYHLVIRPLLDGEMSRFMDWIGGTHTMGYHA